jgi:hypothetical protein
MIELLINGLQMLHPEINVYLIEEGCFSRESIFFYKEKAAGLNLPLSQ